MQIDIKADEAKLTNVNLSTEGSDENPTSRTDLDFECLAPASALATLLGINDVKSFWDGEGNLRMMGITKITSRAEMNVATVKFGDLEIDECKAKKFSFKPLNGRQVQLWCQIQVHHTKEQLVKLDAMQKTTHALHIFTKQAGLFE